MTAVALLATLAGAGCSHLTSRPPPPRPLQHPDECSDSLWPVVGDGYLAVNTGGAAALVLGAAALVRSQRSTEVVPTWDPKATGSRTLPLVAVGAALAIATGAFVRSAVHGVASARACTDARNELLQRTP